MCVCVRVSLWASLSVAQPPLRPLPGSALLFRLTDRRTDGACSPSVRSAAVLSSLLPPVLSVLISLCACARVSPPPSFSPLPVLSSLTDGWKWRHVAADPRSRAACSTWSSAHTAVFCCWSSFVVACARIVRGVSVPGRVGGFILF